MDLKLCIGILIGLIITLSVMISIIKWRHGRARRIGRQGEKMVSKVLRKLNDREYYTFNDVLLPTRWGSSVQIDHLIVSTRGIFVIETKNHAGRIVGSEHSQYWHQHLSSESRQMYNPLLQNQGHIRALKGMLKISSEVPITSIIVFNRAWRIEVKADEIIEYRTLLKDRHIRRTFQPSQRVKRHWWCPGKEVRLEESQVIVTAEELTHEIKRRQKVLERDEMQTLCEEIERRLIDERGAKRHHTSYARSVAGRVERDIRNGNCPRCGGRLVIKKGYNEEFIGCENYPDCRFTCCIDRAR